MSVKACVENLKRQEIAGEQDKGGRLMVKWLLVIT